MRRYSPSLDGFASDEDYDAFLEEQEEAEELKAEIYQEIKQMERVFNQ